MARVRDIAALALICALACGCAPRVSPVDEVTLRRTLAPTVATVRIARTVDGDTVALASGDHIRLIGINTPELGTPGADEAARFTRALVEGVDVCAAYSGIQPRDFYNRRLGVLYVDGPGGLVCVNAEILRYGFAKPMRVGPTGFDVRAMAAGPAPLLPKPAAALVSAASRGDEWVYATRTGAKYHRQGCRNAKGASPLSLASAIARGLEPCATCKPPVVGR
jgi:endonuclease YncB( thermonuclease family)